MSEDEPEASDSSSPSDADDDMHVSRVVFVLRFQLHSVLSLCSDVDRAIARVDEELRLLKQGSRGHHVLRFPSALFILIS